MTSKPHGGAAADTQLGLGYAVREELKKLERHLPLPIQKALLRVAGDRYNPYTRENDLTRSIFVHVPKTGGTSVARGVYGVWKSHYPLSRYAAFDAERYQRYFKFAFVRNPWDRLLSAYSHLSGSGQRLPPPEANWARANLSGFRDFEAFVMALRDSGTKRRITSYVVFRPQLSWLTLPGSSKVEVDFLGRFEQISSDYAVVAERLGVDSALPYTNKSRHPSYRDAYSNEMRDIAGEVYSADISTFGYQF